MIRPFLPSDKDDILSIWRETSAYAHPFLTPAFSAQAEAMIRDHMVDMAETWLLEAEGAPVGFVALIGNEVGGLFVLPGHHGRGFGRALMDHAVNQRGAVELDVFSQNAVGRRFYDRYGFVPAGERLDEMSGERVTRMTYAPG